MADAYESALRIEASTTLAHEIKTAMCKCIETMGQDDPAVRMALAIGLVTVIRSVDRTADPEFSKLVVDMIAAAPEIEERAKRR